MAKKKKRTNNHPLRLHKSGRWYKVVRRKFWYFGKDEAKALELWREQMDDIKAGRTPKKADGSPTLEELGNLYLDRCRKLVASGEMASRSVSDATNTLKKLCKLCGKESRLSQWTPADFLSLKAELAKPVARTASVAASGLRGRAVTVRAPGTVAGDIRRIKAFLSWVSSDDMQLIPRPRYGSDFSVTKKVLRRSRSDRGRLDLPAEQIRGMIDRATVKFRPILYLGINAGLGARDLAEMTLEQVEKCVSDPWLCVRRGKTGASRRAWLWPETQQAIADYLETRKRPYNGEYDSVGFLTARRRPWLEEKDGKIKDSVGWTFAKIRKELGFARGTFYDLRRTVETIGGETLEQVALDFIMGHAPEQTDMAAVYRQHISDDRVKKVCEHVRAWLLHAAVTGEN